jgi:hypothetical protein
MSKRGRGGDQLTGGSHDVNPQWLTFNAATQSAANTFVETSINVPITRFPQGKGKSLVLELLKVQFVIPELDNNSVAGGQVSQAEVQLSPQSQTAIALSNPVNIAQFLRSWRGAFTAAGTYSSAIDNTVTQDLTDGAGHGILVASDTLFLDANTILFTNAATFACRVLYRFKTVTLEEYIGIVQSQQ